MGKIIKISYRERDINGAAEEAGLATLDAAGAVAGLATTAPTIKFDMDVVKAHN